MKLFTIAVAASSVCQSSAFTVSPFSDVSVVTKSALAANPVVSRKRAFQDVIATTIATVTIGTTVFTPNANAVTFGGIDATPEESLRYVKRAVKALEKLELSVANNDYVEVRNGLRSPSLDTLRKYCNRLSANGEGTEKEVLDTQYKTFVKTFEKLDSQCNLAVRGKKDVPILDLYNDSLKQLKAFADTAEKVEGVTAVEPTPEVKPEPTPEVAAE